MTTNRVAEYLDPPAPKKTVLKGTGVLVTTRRSASLNRVVRAVSYAVQGLKDAWASEPNLRVHTYFGAGLVVLGMWCGLGITDWLWLSFAIGLVIFAELMNTSIEQTVNLVVGTTPDPAARRIKDLSAGCVLMATILAVILESFIFIPHLLGQ